MQTVTTIVNNLSDRILRVEANLELLKNLRWEILLAAAPQPAAAPQTDNGTGTRIETYGWEEAPAKPDSAAPAPRKVALKQPSPRKPAAKAPRKSPPAKAGSPTAKMDAWLKHRMVGVPIVLREMFEHCDLSTDSDSGEYKTAQSAISRWIRAGKLKRAGHGQVELTGEWSPSGATPSAKEQAYATFRADLNIKVPEIEGAAPCLH